MITIDDIRWLLKSLPLELVKYIIASYNPSCFFIMDSDWLSNYNWPAQCKAIFNIPNGDLQQYYNLTLRHRHYGYKNVRLYSCGNNFYGQLGIGDNDSISTFEEIQDIPHDIVRVVCGKYHTVVIRSNGTLMACGANDFGQLGLGDRINRKRLTTIPNIPDDIVQVACGFDYTIIMRANGTLLACGSNSYGQLGLGDSFHRNTFEIIPDLPNDIVHISCGYYHTIATRSDGTLMGCGRNDCGQLAMGNIYDTNYVFKQINYVKNVMQVVCGRYHTMIVDADGTLWSSGGCPDTYILGQSYRQTNRFKGVQKVSKVEQVACGVLHTVILTVDGKVFGCGGNIDDQLGHHDGKNRVQFEKMDVEADNIYCGCYNTMVIADGKLTSCGSNYYNQLGYTGTQYGFTKLKGFEHILQIDAGTSHTVIMVAEKI